MDMATKRDAVEMLRVMAEELVLAGGKPGDRVVALANLRAMIAEAKQLRKDRERLDYIEARMAVVWPPTKQSKRWVAMPVPYGSNNGDGGGATLREAIDAAMKVTP